MFEVKKTATASVAVPEGGDLLGLRRGECWVPGD